jgi:cell division protein FtsI (penicillin-binding protein 3)
MSVPGDSDWYPIQLATNSFGQGIAVTPIQLAAAFPQLPTMAR